MVSTYLTVQYRRLPSPSPKITKTPPSTAIFLPNHNFQLCYYNKHHDANSHVSC